MHISELTYMSAKLPRHQSLQPPIKIGEKQISNIKTIHEEMNKHRLQLDNGEQIDLAHSNLIQTAKATSSKALNLDRFALGAARNSHLGSTSSRKSVSRRESAQLDGQYNLSRVINLQKSHKAQGNYRSRKGSAHADSKLE